MLATVSSIALARAATWAPKRPPKTLRQAAKFVAANGFALLFPAPGIEAPSLYEAVAGPDETPWANGMGEFESLVWTWKDALPEAGLAWGGKLLYRRACVIAPDLLNALYPGPGEPDDHRDFDLSNEAHRLADALLPGPLTTSALREVVNDRSRFERAMAELHRPLLVSSAGVREQRTGWPVTVVDLTCRLFEVGGGFDRPFATQVFLRTMVEATAGQLARAFGWPLAQAKAQLAALAKP